jgi:hypothetical protein
VIEKIEEIIGAPLKKNQLLDFTIMWTGGGEREAELTIEGLQGLIEEHGNPSPHSGLSQIAAIKLNGQQVWP